MRFRLLLDRMSPVAGRIRRRAHLCRDGFKERKGKERRDNGSKENAGGLDDLSVVRARRGRRVRAPGADARCHGGCGSRSVWRGVTERKGSRIHRRRARGHRWRGGNDPRGHRGGRLPRQGLHRPALRSLGYGRRGVFARGPHAARRPHGAADAHRVRSGFRRVADAGEYEFLQHLLARLRQSGLWFLPC